MDEIQRTLIKAGRKDLAQKYYHKIKGGVGYSYKKVNEKGFTDQFIDTKKIVPKIAKDAGASAIDTFLEIGLKKINGDIAGDVGKIKGIYNYTYPVKMDIKFAYNTKTKNLDVQFG